MFTGRRLDTIQQPYLLVLSSHKHAYRWCHARQSDMHTYAPAVTTTGAIGAISHPIGAADHAEALLIACPTQGARAAPSPPRRPPITNGVWIDRRSRHRRRFFPRPLPCVVNNAPLALTGPPSRVCPAPRRPGGTRRRRRPRPGAIVDLYRRRRRRRHRSGGDGGAAARPPPEATPGDSVCLRCGRGGARRR